MRPVQVVPRLASQANRSRPDQSRGRRRAWLALVAVAQVVCDLALQSIGNGFLSVLLTLSGLIWQQTL